MEPLPLPPLAAPSQGDPMLEGHVEMCSCEPHTSRVAAQLERAQRPHADALRHCAEGLAGERAADPRHPSLAVPPLGAFVFALPANLAPHEAEKDPRKCQLRVPRACEQGLFPCATLLEGLWKLPKN